MLKYALGELRRIKSEKISLDPPGPDFVQKLEMRCQGLLDAQAAYADAIRSVDLHWAAMSGFRVGEMYRTLHRHLMMIPPTEKAKTESDKQLFYGIMHVRYRALLEKGIEMMKRTLGLGERTGVASAWMKRAEAAKAEMEKALDDEKEAIKRMPFTEEELEKALQIMKRKSLEDAEKAQKKKCGLQRASDVAVVDRHRVAFGIGDREDAVIVPGIDGDRRHRDAARLPPRARRRVVLDHQVEPRGCGGRVRPLQEDEVRPAVEREDGHGGRDLHGRHPEPLVEARACLRMLDREHDVANPDRRTLVRHDDPHYYGKRRQSLREEVKGRSIALCLDVR
jgi:hypothetical protein